MDFKQYIPQIIAGILVLLGGGSLQYQASDSIDENRAVSLNSGIRLADLRLELELMKRDVDELKKQRIRPD